MLQTWHDLVFLHARVPVQVLQTLVPPELTVEEFDGSGWLGFVPFWMSGIRPRWFPAAPWLSSFNETNVRTYVTHPVHGPGVWFFSLEASRYLACLIARMGFRLPYFHASMSRAIASDHWSYSGQRFGVQGQPKLPIQTASVARYSVEATRTGEWHCAEPRTLEYWLVERYRLYSLGSPGQLLTAKVHHEPYQIAAGSLESCDIEGLADLFGDLAFDHVLLAKTLRVECFSPVQVQNRT